MSGMLPVIFVKDDLKTNGRKQQQQRSKDRFTIYTLIPEKTGSRTETGLNSPRGKYSKRHGERRKVNLYSDDIPGVSVSEEQIEKLTLSQLKFWLKSRRINGKIKELLERYVCHPSIVSASPSLGCLTFYLPAVCSALNVFKFSLKNYEVHK